MLLASLKLRQYIRLFRVSRRRSCRCCSGLCRSITETRSLTPRTTAGKLSLSCHTSCHSSPDYCRIVTDRHFSRLRSLLDKTEGKVVLGGQGDRDAKFLEPTVVTEVSMTDSLMQVWIQILYYCMYEMTDDDIFQEEIFGPILPIVRAESVEEAVKLVNSRDKPLALYVFTGRDKVGGISCWQVEIQ